MVAGNAALVRSYFTDARFAGVSNLTQVLLGNGFNPSAALVKAVLINSAGTWRVDDRVGWIMESPAGKMWFPHSVSAILTARNRATQNPTHSVGSEYSPKSIKVSTEYSHFC